MQREWGRQLMHIAIGIGLIGILYGIGRNALLVLSFFGVVAGSLLINLSMQGKKLPIVQLAERLERDRVDFPGYGSAWYMIGVLLLASYLTEPAEIASGIFLLGVSDGLSTLIGMHGTRKLPFNSGKTWEGAVAFVMSGLIVGVWIGWLAVPLALLAGAVEALKLPWDDNITVPVVATVFLLAV